MTIPTVRILPGADEQICEFAGLSRDGLETGGILLGRGPDVSNVITIERAGDPGPGATRRADYFLRDLPHARQLADAAWREDQVIWVGEWHTHPTGLVRPSSRDLNTYSALLTDSELEFTAFVSIIVIPDPDWDEPRLLIWTLGAHMSVDGSNE